MKQIKQTQILVTILALAALPAFAADEMKSDRTELYRAQETSIDVFATGSINQETVNNLTGINYEEDIEFGAGVGINHFFTRNFGLSVETYSESTERHFLDSASISLIGRYPLGDSGFAPYLFLGGGRQFDPIELSFGQAGLGMEFRFNAKWGTFTDARFVMTDGAKDHGLVRLGVRLVF